MLDLLSEIKSTLSQKHTVAIENVAFRLHWLFTTPILIFFAMLLTARQYVGQPINCLIDSSIVPPSLINTYCWISQTFLVPSTFNEQIGIHVPHPGISNSHNQRLMFRNPQYYASSERKYYPYYQWICFVLFMQGVCFYLPHYMWKSAEGGLMRHLSTDLKFAPTDEEEQEVKNRALSNYLLQHFRLFNGYAYKYCLFELLCLLNAIGQFALTDLFLQGHFRWFGWNVLGQSQLAQYWKSDLNSTNETASSIPEVNTMTYIFPRMTKCIFHYFGTSGDVQRSDALCLLPLNVFHEKIYLFIWFWFVAIIALSIAVLLIRLVMLVVPPIRLPLLKSRCQNCSTKHLRVICNKGNFGDYFLFYRLSKNIDTIVMESVIYQVGKSLLKQKHHINNKLPDEQFRRTGSLDRIYDPNNRYIIE